MQNSHGLYPKPWLSRLPINQVSVYRAVSNYCVIATDTNVSVAISFLRWGFPRLLTQPRNDRRTENSSINWNFEDLFRRNVTEHNHDA